MAKMGRPRKEIDRDQFERFCSILCTEEEIAGFFKCDVRTLERWCRREFGKTFVEVYKIYAANGKMSLRRMQFKLAEKSAAMAIFLGKNLLGQTDYVKMESQADGKLAELIDGLKEPINDIHEETESLDGLMADQPPKET
jgi:hypothetical protein